MSQNGQVINNRNLFLIVLESGKSMNRVPVWSHFGKGLLPGSQLVPSHCVLTCGRDRHTLQGLSYKVTNPIHKVPSSPPKHCAKTPLLNTIISGIRFSTYVIWAMGDWEVVTNIQTIALLSILSINILFLKIKDGIFPNLFSEA